MWLFTKRGLFSAVAGKHPDGTTDLTKVVVRARDRSHLVGLRELIAVNTDDFPIHETKGTDYPCRLILSPDEWREAVTRLAEEADYTNFKDAAHDDADPAWNDLLMRVWAAGLNYQRSRGNRSRSKKKSGKIRPAGVYFSP